MGYNTTRPIGGITKIVIVDENLRQTGRRKEMSALLEVKKLKIHFLVKHGPSPCRSGFGHAGGMFSHVRRFAALTPNRIALNFPA
jgi:hypothetical protein